MTSRDKLKTKADALSLADRLDYWQEIAKYLGREVRTVQRWEREKNLPVRRLSAASDDNQPRVFAFKSEIDAWLALQSSPRALPANHSGTTSESSPPSVLRVAVLPLENSGGNPESEF